MTRSLVDTKNVEGYSLCLDTRLLHIIVQILILGRTSWLDISN